MGFFTSGRVEAMVDRANEQALKWIKAQESIEIVNINTALSDTAAITTVWYK